MDESERALDRRTFSIRVHSLFSEVGGLGVDEGGFLHGNVADVQYGDATVPSSVTLLDEAPETQVLWLTWQ